jgi:CBS domain-containing protein
MNTLGMLVADHPVHTVTSDRTVAEAAALMADKKIGAVPVVEGDRLVGIFSERDLLVRVVAAGKDPERTAVAAVMTRDIALGAAGDTYQDALRKMKQVGCRHLPVVEGGRLVGMVSLRDLLMADVTQKSDEIQWMREYIYFVPPGVKK